jgi:hypothetical protein
MLHFYNTDLSECHSRCPPTFYNKTFTKKVLQCNHHSLSFPFPPLSLSRPRTPASGAAGCFLSLSHCTPAKTSILVPVKPHSTKPGETLTHVRLDQVRDCARSSPLLSPLSEDAVSRVSVSGSVSKASDVLRDAAPYQHVPNSPVPSAPPTMLSLNSMVFDPGLSPQMMPARIQKWSKMLHFQIPPG